MAGGLRRFSSILVKMKLLAAPILLLALFVASRPARGQNAVMAVRGCGTSCRIETVQLSKPTRMDSAWRKVLVSEQMIVGVMKGKPPNVYSVDVFGDGMGRHVKPRRYWLFANCDTGVIGEGQRSDMKDARFQSVYHPPGTYAYDGRSLAGQPRDSTADGNVYSRWQILCRAL